MKKTVVTTCSVNHLAQAKSLGDSLLSFNPEYKLVIGLVDKLDNRVEAGFYFPHDLVEVAALHIPEFAEMYHRYTTLELNCALKCFFLHYALETYQPDMLFFLDSDILVFDSFKFIEEQLVNNSILLTPHITEPYPDDKYRPQEKEILKTGIFNGGFLGLRNDENSHALLDWWRPRMVDQCYERPKEGLNVDQKWLEFVPLYFKKVKVILHPGCNVAYWNLHQREVRKQGNKYFVNDEPLIFFHYSGYSIKHPGQISRHQNRVSFEGSIELKELFQHYHSALISNDHEKMLLLRCYYKRQPNLFKKNVSIKRR
jgi:hypothetical protein